LIGDKKQIQKQYIADIFEDTLGFAGCKMIRRVIGIAHVADLASIKVDAIRAECEVKVLQFGKKLVMQRSNLKSISDVVELLKI